MAHKTTTATTPMENLGPDASVDGFRTAASAYQSWLQGMGAYNAEAARFIGRRLMRDFELSSRLAKCQAPTDVFEVQSSFVQALVSDYAEEAQRMTALAAGSFTNGVEAKSRDRD